MSTEEHPSEFNFWKSWIFKTAFIIVLIYLLIFGVVEIIDSNIKGEWQTFGKDNSPFSSYQQQRINAIVTDDKQRIWVGTDEGLYMMDSTGAWNSYTSENTPMIVDNLEKVIIDHAGNLWIATSYDLYIFKPEGNIWESVSEDPSLRGIQALAVDHDNQVWIGTDEGLYRFNPANNQQTLLINHDINAVAIDRFNKVWVGTERDGILAYDQKNEDWITYQAGDSGLRSNSICCFFFDQEDDLWVGTRHGGVNILDVNGNWISGKTNPAYNKYTVAAMTSDQQGNIWISMGDRDGSILAYLDGMDGRIYTPDNSRLPRYVSAITVDASNRLWLGSSGLTVIDLSKGLPKTAPHNWIVFRTIIRLPVEIILNVSGEISMYFGYFWYGLVPITLMFTLSGIGIYYGFRIGSKTEIIFSCILLIVTIALTLFFCNFMAMALFVQG